MLQTITDLSRKYGSDKMYILAGGGNTSCKDENFLYVKPSGVSLANINPEDFVKMDRSIIHASPGEISQTRLSARNA